MAEKKRKKSGGLSKGLIYGLMFLVILPVASFVGWYVLSFGLDVKGSRTSMSAEQLAAEQAMEAQQAARNQVIQRASAEGFAVDSFDSCAQVEDQYRLPVGAVFTELTARQLLGLPADATEEQMRERCVIFAKVVREMEKLAHHDRHVFVCQGAEFATDESGMYRLIADPGGRGVIQQVQGQRQLTPIQRGSHTLIRSWQVYNLGDGCIIVGLSKSGVFSMSGKVRVSR